MASRINSNVISLTRVYDAPLAAVWDAWTQPDEVAQWWGPRGFTLTTHSRDLRTGGHWHYTMHGPDGTDYENTTQYLDVLPMQRLVYDHGGHRDRPPLFRVTALFTERDGRTQLDMDLGGVVGASLLSVFRITLGDEGRFMWLEPDIATLQGPEGPPQGRAPQGPPPEPMIPDPGPGKAPGKNPEKKPEAKPPAGAKPAAAPAGGKK